jgi:hypothetical protein
MRGILPAAVILLAASSAGCVDPVQILSLRLEKVEKDQVTLVAILDTDLEQSRYAECNTYFAYVIVDDTFSGRLVVGEDGRTRRLERDSRENDQFLDLGLGHEFVVFKPSPGDKPKTADGWITPAGPTAPGRFAYEIAIPRSRTGDEAHEEPGEKDWVKEYYLLERGKGYHLWARIAGYRYIDFGFKSDVVPLGFRMPD